MQRAVDVFVQRLDHIRRCAGRRDHTEPIRYHHVWQAQFLERRHIGQARHALVGRNGKHLDARRGAGGMRQEQAGQFDVEVDVAGDQIVDGGRAAPVGHVRRVGAGLFLEQFRAQVRCAAGARGRVVEFFGIGLGVLDQRGRIRVWRLVVHTQRHGAELDEGHGREIARRVERHRI
ncbi:hypothetical protein D3C72_1212550 [compost metagenome]